MSLWGILNADNAGKNYGYFMNTIKACSTEKEQAETITAGVPLILTISHQWELFHSD